MYHIGCSGWFYRHWKGKFYPDDIKQKDWFSHYSGIFNTVEMNSPFYRFPTKSTMKQWNRQSPEGFVYTMKVNRMITHIKKFKDVSDRIRQFYEMGDILGDKMGCFLFQLPPNLQYSDKKLKEIVGQLDLERKNAIEFRHTSWFTDTVYKELRKSSVMFCVISSPELPEEFAKTADDIYLRFHGKPEFHKSRYDKNELRTWADKIKKSKAKNAWIYFNNDYDANAPNNALELQEMLQKK